MTHHVRIGPPGRMNSKSIMTNDTRIKIYRPMKRLCTIATALLLCVAARPADAQEYRLQLGNDANRTVRFAVGQSDVIVEGHDSDEIVIRNLDYEEPPERAKGLRALYYSAEDNTGIGLSVEQENGTLNIIQASNDGGEYRLTVPDRVRLMIEQVNWGGGDYDISNYRGEIEILSKNGDVRMENVTGPVILSSTSGDVEIDFSSLSQVNPTSISLVSGFIDITLPADSRADFNLSSISGEIYTNLDIDLQGDTSEMRRIGGNRTIEGTLNGGGVEVGLKTISGEIYLRQK